MYVLNLDGSCCFDAENINDFIDSWRRYYDEGVPGNVENNEPIDYIHELNLGNPLTEQNIVTVHGF